MLTQNEMTGFQSESHELIETANFRTCKDYVLHLIHARAYEYAAALAVDKQVLDLGCNTGYGSCILRDSARAVTGVDVSEKAISKARANSAAKDITFHVIDGRRLPFEDNSFDLVVSFQVIEHIIDYAEYFNEIRRVLIPGGTAIFSTPNSLLRLYPGMVPWNRFHVREFDHAGLKQLLEQYFTTVRIYGLFAAEPVYRIEKQRLNLIRERSRISQDAGMPVLLKRIRIMKLKLRASISKRMYGSVRQFQQKYSGKDLHYLESRLEEALDLLAVCRNDDAAGRG